LGASPKKTWGQVPTEDDYNHLKTEAILPDLQCMIDAWSALQETAQQVLLAIIDAVDGHPDEASR